ncbi:glycosyltransferase family 4 protein [Micromonospora sp. DT43]|uniref:glycosyltransferase family 4 protein n=1 Tax=Micromonospora sp. DT43 TaxID=3393440 RepID=UPI003CF45CF7
MRILLVQNMPDVPAYGGANRSNRIMLEQLAARGHDCAVVATVPAAEVREAVVRAGGDLAGEAPGVTRYVLRGVRGHAVHGSARLVREILAEAGRHHPDWILVPSDDPGTLALGAALTAAPRRVVYLVHTLQQLPFGPGAFYPSEAATALVRRAAGIVAVSRAARDHVRRWAGLPSHLIHPAVYGRPDRCGGDAVLMVNPCGYKGIDILLALADRFPRLPFAVVPTWGTTTADRERLARRPNIEVLAKTNDMDAVYARARVVLTPSLWDETFGYTAVEAALRGIPVLSSDVGGLREAKLGVPHLLPVRPIERYGPGGEPVIPPQDVTPWSEALDAVTGDPAHHADLAARSRAAAWEFVTGIDERALERYLRSLAPAPDATTVAGLSPHARARLAARLDARR